MSGGPWRGQAACDGKTDIFFGPDHETLREQTARENIAKSICSRCPVVEQCLDWGLQTGNQLESTVVGGLTSQQIRSMRAKAHRAKRLAG